MYPEIGVIREKHQKLRERSVNATRETKMKHHYDNEMGKLKRIASEQRRFDSHATTYKILPSEKAKPWRKESLITDQLLDHDTDMKKTRS